LESKHHNSINLNKYISSTGICSRREAEKFITSGAVTLNGKVAQLGNRVGPGDQVRLHGKPLQAKPKSLYIALNKPVGIVCTTDSKEKKNIVRFVNHPERLFPIGRLDKPSQGLIFLTNDGDIVNKILRAGNKHEKEYLVTVDKPVTDTFVQKMSKGIPVLGTITNPCKVTQTGNCSFKIVLTQGLNRQIRRMCNYLDYEVLKLNRVRIMNISLDNLKVGEWRVLSKAEMAQLNQLTSHSSKTEEASRDKHKKRPTTKGSNSKQKRNRKF